ncbi:hypothetical protein [Planctomicrobium sp. SH664]|uniref:hypothetical protein n=1 Tax=Planctomicrobium sp. SH664 TaxID=3448125 RepID=UPI003F5B10B4
MVETPPPSTRWKWRRPTLTEWLLVIAILSVVAAILVPPVKWGASGSITIPVRVIVFDAREGRPLEKATVSLLRYSPDFKKGEYPPLPSSLFEELRSTGEFRTDSAGSVTISQTWRTEANHNSPDPFVILVNQWVVVSAEGYAPVVTTLRHDTARTEALQRRGEILVGIGLTKHVESSPSAAR